MGTDSSDALAWTRAYSPILRSFAEDHREPRPFDGYTIAVCSSATTNTGVFIETLRTAGAEYVPFTTESTRYNEPAVIESLDRMDGVEAFVDATMDEGDLDAAHGRLLETEPDLIIEDGGILSAKLHAEYHELAEEVIGGVEQTTLGVTRLRAMERDGVLGYPVYAANDSPMKRQFDNVHATGETALMSIVRTTDTLLAGHTVVVAGYGDCGRGVASKARALGGRTIVTEVDPRRALNARMDGHWVMPMDEAAPLGDYFICATGNVAVLRREHFEAMTDRAIVASAGAAAEIAVDELADLATEPRSPRPGVTQYHLPDGRRINLLADGYVVNLAAPHSTGHPAEVMDTTFGVIYVAAHHLLAERPDLAPGVHQIPDRLDRDVGERTLEAMGVAIDELTPRQTAYIEDWEHAETRM